MPIGEVLTGNQRLGDFVLLRELGRGSFARVYLAHQVSLERRVALKLTRTPNRGEGQTLAGLEHDHIVKVYAEFSDPPTGSNGLVLQYIPGTSLAEVLNLLFREGCRPEQGADILRAIDQLARDEVGFDPAALRDRELLARGDYLSSICRLGARLAEALAFAHARGILHCDVKPANILLNRYGRPLLADFNVAVPLRPESGGDHYLLGGTVLYMAPEQLAAFARLPEGDPRQVDRRADLYSLGLVLLEALTGKLPHRPSTSSRLTERVLEWKRQGPDHWFPDVAPVPALLWRVLRRCLDPDPGKRYSSGTDLARALHHAADLVEAPRHLAEAGLAGFTRRHPIAALLIVALLPHLIGTVVNIVYNAGQISLRPDQERVFSSLVVWYNLTVYPICLFLGWGVLGPVVRLLSRRDELTALPAEELDQLRGRALNLGSWAILLALLGWLPGGIVFPLVLHVTTGWPGEEVYLHFLMSFTLSGLIAVVYSYLGAQYVILRALYPRLVHAELDPAQVRAELGQTVRWVGWFQVLAALVPLTGAILLLTLGPGEMSLVFRFLVVALILAGMVGLGIAVWVAHSLRELVTLLSGPQGGRAHEEGTYFG